MFKGDLRQKVAEDIAAFLRVHSDSRWQATDPAVQTFAARMIRDVDPTHPDGYADGVEPPVEAR